MATVKFTVDVGLIANLDEFSTTTDQLHRLVDSGSPTPPYDEVVAELSGDELTFTWEI